EMIREYNYGASYGAYHRLRVGEVTSFLAATVARAKGHDPSSDATEAIRELVAAWRDNNYKPNKQDRDADPTHARATENQFLFDYDAAYGMRRVIFLIRRINELAQYARRNDSELLERLKRMLRSSLPRMQKREQLEPQLFKKIEQWLNGTDSVTGEAGVWLGAFIAELQRIKKTVLSEALKKIRAFLEAPLIADASIMEQLRRFELTWAEMKEILESKGAVRSSNAGEHIKTIEPLAKAINIQY